MTSSNSELIRNMKERKAYLEDMLKQALEQSEKLKNMPDEKIRIQKHGNTFQYYIRKDKKDTSGKYVKKDQMKVVKTIMQKEYLQKVIKEIKKELSIIDQYLDKINPDQLSAPYENLHNARKIMIDPLEIGDEEYVKKWMSVTYRGKEFLTDAPEYYTQKMERVRSKSEIIIANMLEKYNIPYRYEYPIHVKGIGTIYPDFTVLNVKQRKEIYMEHFGLIDSKDYRENAMRKLAAYEKNHIYPGDNLIVTYESLEQPLDIKLLERKLRRYLM